MQEMMLTYRLLLQIQPYPDSKEVLDFYSLRFWGNFV